MGLDNGIVVRNAKNKYKGIKDFWGDIDAGNDIEVAYWRKCWGIRDSIIKELKVNGDGEFKLNKDNILAIINILVYFFDEKIWNNEANSI